MASRSSRRDFLREGALTAGVMSPALLRAAVGKNSSSQVKGSLCVFNKPLQHLDYDGQAELVAEMGFDGIEGTVRSGGHVEPKRVEEDLPKQIAALRKNGIEMTLMTTDVNNVESDLHRTVLKTAADLGVKRFRMGSIRLSREKPIPEQLDRIKVTFSEIVEFCKPLSILPLYQNHAGAGRFGAAIWDLYEVLKDFEPSEAGIAFDIRHATVEGGQSWPTEFQLVRPWFGMVYCKDFTWKDGSSKPNNVPLGTGRVDYPAFIKLLKQTQYSGPISLHMEYKNHRDPKLLKESVAAIRADYAALVGLLE